MLKSLYNPKTIMVQVSKLLECLFSTTRPVTAMVSSSPDGALRKASCDGDVTTLKDAIENGADVNATDEVRHRNYLYMVIGMFFFFIIEFFMIQNLHSTYIFPSLRSIVQRL